MGSSLSSRYWVCPSCFNQFDWNAKEGSGHNPKDHDEKLCKKENK